MSVVLSGRRHCCSVLVVKIRLYVLLGGSSYVAGAKGVFVENAVCCRLSKVILIHQAFKQGKWSLSVNFCLKATLASVFLRLRVDTLKLEL